MKKVFTLAILCFAALASNAQLNLTYISDLGYGESLNDIWGYVAPDGTEYALVGAANGTSIVSLADPTNPMEVAYVPGDNSVWRDIKTWGEFAYVTTDSGNDGLTIIDMTNLPTSVSTTYITSIPGVGTLTTCHNIYIDEFGYAYLAGCNLNSGGMLIFDCNADQANPPLEVLAPSNYAHDVYVLANRMYASEIYNGQFVIYDVSDKSNIQVLGSQETPFAFTHNAWLSKDSTVLFTTDEQANAPIGAYDVTDPTDIQELDTYVPFETLGDGVIPHNVHVWEDWLIVSYYTDGCILVDVSHPDNMIEVGNFDTYIPANTGFSGAWGAYPYLPSGLVLVSDIGNGLYILEPNYVHACYLEGTVADAVSGDPISAASVDILSTLTFDATDALGEFKTGLAISGTYDLEVKRPGYETAIVSIDMENGVTTTVNIQLQPLPSISITGTVVESGSGNPVEDAQVSINDDDGFFSYELTTDASGNFNINMFFEGDYTVAAGKWGYKTNLTEDQNIDGSAPIVIELDKGYEDIFSLDLGWTAEGNNLTGDWVREVSIPQVAGPGLLLTPDEDLPNDDGNSCYMTANGVDLFNNVLINGNALLTSPVFDIAAYNEPKMSFYQWYMNLDVSGYGYPPPGDDPFIVTLYNGIDTVIVSETVFNGDLYELGWAWSGNIDIASLMEPTDNMWITFEASAEFGFNIITEAAVDYFKVWDAMPTSTNEVASNKISISAYPNPSTDAFTLAYNLKDLDANAQIKVSNLIGQTMEIISVNSSTDLVRFGEQLSPGIYFVRLENGTEASKTLKIIKQ